PRHADPARDEGPQHGEEATRLTLDRTAVAADPRHLAKAVEQCLARHANLVEPEPAVVDTVQAALVTAILDPDAAVRSPALVPDRHQEDVHPSAFAGGHELREYGGHPAVARHVPDVVLPGVVVRRVDHEFFVLGIVGRDRPDRLHVGAVPGFRHGEAAGQLHG